MAITASDILLKLSTTAGAAGNANTSTPAASLGKYVSTTTWTTGTNVVFDSVTGDENAASTVDYRCIFVHNAHATLALLTPVVYISAQVAGGTSVEIAVDNVAASVLASSSAQAAQIANETTAPTPVGAFSAPTTKAAGLSLGATLPAGQVKAVWIRRTAANSAALDADGFTLSVAGDTAA